MGVEKTCESERSQVLNMFWLQPVANLFNSTPVGHKHAQFLTSRPASSNDQDPGNFSLLLLQLDFLTRFSQATARSDAGAIVEASSGDHGPASKRQCGVKQGGFVKASLAKNIFFCVWVSRRICYLIRRTDVPARWIGPRIRCKCRRSCKPQSCLYIDV